jgi:hypothetical protein
LNANEWTNLAFEFGISYGFMGLHRLEDRKSFLLLGGIDISFTNKSDQVIEVDKDGNTSEVGKLKSVKGDVVKDYFYDN